MDVDNILKLYGLEPSRDSANNIRELLIEEIEKPELREHEYLKTLCIQLYAIGDVNDTSLIWLAKEKDFDAHCYIDVQLLCGAGYETTIGYLKKINNKEAKKELSYLIECKDSDFLNFSKEEVISFHRQYYNIK